MTARLARLPVQYLGVLVVALLAACWSLLSPLASVPDEPAHVIYAAAVVRGELGAPGGVVDVPASAADAGRITCTAFKSGVTADCIPALVSGQDSTPSVTPAAGYPPLYYALVGWPSLLGFGESTWYVMRLLSVLLGAVLLAAGTAVWPGQQPFLAVGLLLAATPMTLFLLGSVNPNGAEIVAGVAVALGVTGLIQRVRTTSVRRVDALLVALPFAYLCVARPSTYLLALGLVGALGISAVGRSLASGRLLLLAGPVALATAVLADVAGRWGRVGGAPGAAGADSTASLRGALSATLHHGSSWAQESVGLFGWRDHQVPPAFRVVWLLAIAVLVVAALRHGRAASRASLIALIAGGFVVGPFFVLLTVFGGAVGYQGRYAMALTQAVPVLAAAVLAAAQVRLPARLAAGTTIVAYALGVAALLGSGLRYAVGLPLPRASALIDTVVWVPPTWPGLVVALAMSAAAAALLALRLLHADEPIAA